MQHENRLRRLSESIKCNKISALGIPQEEREKGAENLFQEIIAENFPDLGKETDFQIQEVQRTPTKINKSRPTPRHIVINFAKYSDSEKILKAERQKNYLTYEGRPIRLAADLNRNLASQKGVASFKVLNGKNLQARILYPVKLSFRIEGEIKKLPRQTETKGVHDH